MNLTTCPDCEKSVSRSARSCPHCGHPFSERTALNKGLFLFCLIAGIAVTLLVLFKSLGQPEEDVMQLFRAAVPVIVILFGSAAAVRATRLV